MPDFTSTEMARRIEELYGALLVDLQAHAQDQPPGMLAALLGMHDALALAERSITFHRDRLAQLITPERQIGAHEVSHVLDGARRLAEAVAVRDTQAASAQAVLHSLGRADAPATPPAPVPAMPAPAPRAAGAAPSR
ncbi:hypothetical protein ACFC0M_06010 [Streptomyces sp. NPDC056149]|uniref:hypothetical protein n=1 Tax=Streptomyces sp. NPDC056149 TaxID=3345728 RepID=UPI0035E0DE20